MANSYEKAFQIGLIQEWYLRVAPCDAIIWAIANGEKRDAKTAAELLKSGVLAGIPDLEIATWGGRTCRVEIKLASTEWHDKTYLRRSQREIHDLMRAMGHDMRVVRTADEFWNVMQDLDIPTRGLARISLPEPSRAAKQVKVAPAARAPAIKLASEAVVGGRRRN